VGRRGIALLVVLVALAVAVAAASRGGDKPGETQFRPPAASKQFGDDADLMRRLERKKLTTRAAK
jgi:type II secretory pathway component PulK